MDAAPHDRALSERRLQIYERLAKAGQFRPISWASAFCKETETTYRVNGKHTSTLFSSIDVLPEIYVTIEEYDCDTLEDVAKLYGTYDSKLAARTAHEINSSFAGAIPELGDIPRNHIHLAVSGLSYHEDLDNYGSRPATERAERLFDNIDFVIFMSGIYGIGRKNRHMERLAVTAAMVGSYRKAKHDAEKFWTAIRDETGESPSLPDRKLARYLITTGVNNGAGALRARKAPNREIYVKCIHAWNAWRKHVTTDLKFYVEGKVPSFF